MQPETQAADHYEAVPRWQQLLADSHLDIDTVLRDMPRPAPNNPQLSAPKARVETIRHALALLTAPGQVVELRILGTTGKKRTDSGYFQDMEKLAKAAISYDGRAEGLYFTLNPVKPALLARANNRVKEYAAQTTSDNDIVRRITLPIDFDPVRPAGISATDAEKQAALERAWLFRAWLLSQGWPAPIYADSGNGAHLLYAIDMPNTAETTEQIKRCLTTLSILFSDDVVKVDASTSNASRIFKLYGTLACKGDSTTDRPHRRAGILAAPTERQLVDEQHLEELAVYGVAASEERGSRPTAVKRQENKVYGLAYGQAALQAEIATLSAAQDGNRNNQLFQSSAALFSLVAAGALKQTEVWTALLNSAQAMGLSEIEARRTIASGERHGREQPRTKSKLEQPRANNSSQTSESIQTPNTPDQSVHKPSLMHIDELDSLPPIRWLIKDVLPADSLIEMHGAPGTGKTQVIFDMAQSLAATGQPVIYVVAEGLQGYRGRKQAWQKFRKQPGGELYVWGQAVHLFEPEAVRAFIQVIKPKKPVLVVFDTLSRCSLGADENNQKDMNFILEGLDAVRRETGATVVAVHHTNASGLRERGSTVIRGGMDAMIEVSKEDDLIIVSCSKMKDAGDFEAIYLKPVLIDIGEENPVPVLVPAEKRTQTQADKLTMLQLDILRAIGMEMFAESGIKSNQLDEILPPTTKRASKYHSLNTLIRLGYVKPHVKGDPYHITDDGRQKLSSAESSTTSAKSKMSNPSPSMFIWTIPMSCPMSSPVPHTEKCGTDETADKGQTIDGQPSAPDKSPTVASSVSPVASTMSISQSPESSLGNEPMTQEEFAVYAKRADVVYPTTNGADLYRICAMIPKVRRAAFENGLGDAVSAFYEELAKVGTEPTEPEPDPVESFVRSGLVTAAELFSGYEKAREAGRAEDFLAALKERNEKAAEVLTAWISGKQINATVYIPKYF